MLPPLLPWLATLSCICFLLFFNYLRRRYCSSRFKIQTPCPDFFPVIGNLVGFIRNRHRFHDWVTDMLVQTPSLTLRVHTFLDSSHGVCTANPAVLRHLLLSNFPNYVKGSRYRSVLGDLLGDGIFAADADLWITQRKIASLEFTTRSLRMFIAGTVAFQLSRHLLPLLSSACDRGEVVDLQDVFRKFTFDNICSVAFGVDPEWLCSDEQKASTNASASAASSAAFVRAFDDAAEISFGRFLAPVQAAWKIKRALNLGSEKKLRNAIETIDGFAMNIIMSKLARSREPENDQDLLSRFIYSSSDAGFRDEDLRMKFLRDIVISFVLAGKDSTSTALTWFFWLISGHPRCCREITAELSRTDPGGGAGDLNYDELRQFHYLHAALSESLRLFPPVPMDSRLAVSDDVLPDGSRVGGGWFADYSAYAMGRMERVWGPDCREFKPERWLGGDGTFTAADQFRFPAFHGGPRMCLGKEMAYVQMKLIAASVMREFDVVAVDGGASAEKMVNPPYTLSLLLKMKGGLPVTLRRKTAHCL